MSRSTILLLEDDVDRLNGFNAAVGKLGLSYRLVFWRDANRMLSECHEFLTDAALISLDQLFRCPPEVKGSRRMGVV